MRIAFFTETFLPKTDGIVTTLCQTIRELRELGHEVLVFAPESGVTEFEHFRVVGMRSHAFPLYPELRLALPRASMRKVLSEFEPDILHVADPAFLGIAALYYGGGKDGGALGLPLVVSYHTDLPNYLRYYRLGFLEPYVWRILRIRHRRAAVNLCTSGVVAAELRQHGVENVALWPGGVDADLFHPSRKSPAMRSRLTDGHPDAPLLLYVGRLSAEKNLESLRPVLQVYPDARLALVGDGPHRKSLEKYFAGLPVHFAGFLYGDELAEAYASSDVFAMPSRTDTLGLVVLEAMCSGVPVVAARAGGLPEMIENGVSGYLVDTDAEAIERIGMLYTCHLLLHRFTFPSASHTLPILRAFSISLSHPDAIACLTGSKLIALRHQEIPCAFGRFHPSASRISSSWKDPILSPAPARSSCASTPSPSTTAIS